ncbi:MAG TPA: hypothetical protein VFC63_12305 [Blastocatellia bacterium]|nr:hypothetical protein [Blastocatellia bacterium]
MRLNRGRAILFTSIAFWLFAIGIGLKYVWSYEIAPGTPAIPSAQWPVDSKIPRIEGQATLVLLAHPHCPCTRATIGELAILMAHCQGKVSAYVLFYKPADFPDDWEQTDLWHSAAAIPGVKVLVDNDGAEAHIFGAATSGQALLYSRNGNLLFSGGITGSRGHSGDNAGRDAITSLLLSGTADRKSTNVYGCDLLGKDTNPNNKDACYATKAK